MYQLLLLVIALSFFPGCTSKNLDSASDSSMNAARNDDWQKNRFLPYMKKLEKSLTSSDDPEEVADELIDGGERGYAFRLQALGRLYRRIDRDFRDFRDDYKNLEDLIGTYDKYADAVGDKRKAEKARKALVKTLEEDDWVVSSGNSRHDDYTDFIENYDFGSYKKDKKEVLESLVEQLDREVVGKDYDMTKLENQRITDSSGRSRRIHGVHEMRRELRWFVKQAQMLNGLVRYDDSASSCPIPEFQRAVDNYLGSSGYVELDLKEPKKKSCSVSKCLFYGIAENISLLGDIKDYVEENHYDEIEKTNTIPDINIDVLRGRDVDKYVTAGLIKRGENIAFSELGKRIHDRVKKTGLISEMMDQLESCAKR